MRDLSTHPQFENMVAADVQRTVDDKFLSALTAEVNNIGQTRFVRFKNEVFTAAFVDHAKALDAVNIGLIRVRSKNLIHKFAMDHGALFIPMFLDT